MSLPKPFIQAWYAWQHSDAPITNSRLRRHAAKTYAIEVQLDHLGSNLYALGIEIIGGNYSENYLPQIMDDLVELNAVKMVLAKYNIPNSEKTKFTKYMILIETVYQEIQTFLNSQIIV